MKASDDQLRSSYAATGNVWKTAEQFGMCGQSVHERLTRIGAVVPINVLSEADKAVLLASYHQHASAGTLTVLARQLGRTKQFICRQARAMGLTDTKRPKPYLAPGCSARAKAQIAAKGHPRGMLGKSQPAKTKAAVSKASTARWAAMTLQERCALTLKGMKTKADKGTLAHFKPHGSWKSDWRTVGGQRCFFRSRWEANYARYLETLKTSGEISAWEHEPTTFWFEKIKRGCRSYMPDFRVTDSDGAIAYHEVKGWMDARSKTKIARMARYHPAVSLVVIDSKAYRKLAKRVGGFIDGWET